MGPRSVFPSKFFAFLLSCDTRVCNIPLETIRQQFWGQKRQAKDDRSVVQQTATLMTSQKHYISPRLPTPKLLVLREKQPLLPLGIAIGFLLPHFHETRENPRILPFCSPFFTRATPFLMVAYEPNLLEAMIFFSSKQR